MKYYDHDMRRTFTVEEVLERIKERFLSSFKFSLDDSAARSMLPEFIRTEDMIPLPENAEELKEIGDGNDTEQAQLMYGMYEYYMKEMDSHEDDDSEPEAYSTYWTVSYHSGLGKVSFKMFWGADETEVMESFFQNILAHNGNGIMLFDADDEVTVE